MRFEFLTGDMNWKDYNGVFVSNRLNNGDFDYYITISWTNVEEHTDMQAKYLAIVQAIAPSEVSDEFKKDCWRSWGMDQEEVLDFIDKRGELGWVELIHSYQGGALIWQGTGNNADKLMKEAKDHAKAEGDMFFGFTMDRAQCAIGTTGWQRIQGKTFPWE